MRLMDLTGKVFGRLTVIGRSGQIGGATTWRCKCACGNEVVIRSQLMRDGATKSCGCIVKIHGRSHTPVYRVWDSMLRRCLNPRHRAFNDYGGRGITVCERWRDFRNFLADMGEQPHGKTLDRIDNNGNYEPGNCRWATWSEQNRNKRGCRLVTVNGVTQPIIAWSDANGWPHHVIAARLRNGWSDERAVLTPLRGSHRA